MTGDNEDYINPAVVWTDLSPFLRHCIALPSDMSELRHRVDRQVRQTPQL